MVLVAWHRSPLKSQRYHCTTSQYLLQLHEPLQLPRSAPDRAAPVPRSRVLVTIDLTAVVLEEAAEFDADLIVAYHPPIFSGIKRFTAAPLVQRAAAAG